MERDARGSGCALVESVELVDNARVGCQVRPYAPSWGWSRMLEVVFVPKLGVN